MISGRRSCRSRSRRGTISTTSTCDPQSCIDPNLIPGTLICDASIKRVKRACPEKSWY